MMVMSNFPLFSVLGLEIEYMLVDKETLAVQPKSDVILNVLAGQQVNEVTLGEIAASNELVMHVIELKNNGPRPSSHLVAQDFQQTIELLQPVLNQHHLQLLPSGAHPWMNPILETERWPHGDKTIYKQFDAIFNCQGHGWANLQIMHVNLPFATDLEFCQLHNTIRLLLPLLPALAASTPILDGQKTGRLSSRLYFYGNNQKIIPSISGDVIPDFIRSEKEYRHKILEPMFSDIRPLDPGGILQHEWLNSRGAIPKFNYGAIEIRILDSQECVNADVAIAHLIEAILKDWYESGSNFFQENICSTAQLKIIYDQAIIDGLDVLITDQAVLNQWLLPSTAPLTIREVWQILIQRVTHRLTKETRLQLDTILQHGNLSERILRACQNDFSRTTLKHVYQQLGDCLLKNQQFIP
jgi:gamma-glutamyl:cysteine ligase YbdK (ATP-grasp superfamily)